MGVMVVPFLKARRDRVKIQRWSLTGVGEGWIMPSWDPNTSITGTLSFTIDVQGVKADCRLADNSKLILGAVWHSVGTTLRGKASSLAIQSSSDQTGELAVEIPGQLLSGDVRIRAQLILAAETSGEPLSPHRAGSILWEDTTLVRLQESGMRFPVEALDFTKTAHLPDKAAWFLEWNPFDLDEPIHASLRLLVNSSNPRVRDAVSKPLAKGEPSLISSFIQFEIARSLIEGALGNDDFVGSVPTTYAEGTCGCSLHRLIQGVFDNEPLVSVRERMKSSPAEFLAELQDALQPVKAP